MTLPNPIADEGYSLAEPAAKLAKALNAEIHAVHQASHAIESRLKTAAGTSVAELSLAHIEQLREAAYHKLDADRKHLACRKRLEQFFEVRREERLRASHEAQLAIEPVRDRVRKLLEGIGYADYDAGSIRITIDPIINAHPEVRAVKGKAESLRMLASGESQDEQMNRQIIGELSDELERQRQRLMRI